jgi:hypothetical protein
MRLLFLIPLGIGLTVSYFSRNFDEEIAYLTSVITITSFVLSLAIAPWQVQLLILIPLLINLKTFLPKNNLEAENTESEIINPENLAENKKIKYRGISYTPNETTNSIVKEEIIGKYRGRNLHRHQLSDNLPTKELSPNKKNLKYRGVNINPDSDS